MTARGKRVPCEGWRVLDLVEAGLTNEQIAVTLGVTTRTLTRWRAARPTLSAAINRIRARQRLAALRPCGTVAAYNRGCRCDTCRTAATERHREDARRARARARASREGVPANARHGTASTYNWYGCRCAPCTTANTEYNRPHEAAYRARRRAAAAS